MKSNDICISSLFVVSYVCSGAYGEFYIRYDNTKIIYTKTTTVVRAGICAASQCIPHNDTISRDERREKRIFFAVASVLALNN